MKSTLRFLHGPIGLACICLSILGLGAASAKDQPVRIGLIGDSTVCDYSLSSPKRGWGQMLPEFFVPGVVIVNEAKGGMSTKSFPKENWERILTAHCDYVFIQFGHNDMKKDQPELYADAETDYRENLRRYISEARAAGITPILVTSMHRRNFKNGRVTMDQEPYAEAMKAVGEETGVAVIDLFTSSGDLFNQLGEDGSEKFTANRLLNPDAARPDLTHFTEAGARQMAWLVVRELPTANEKLAHLLRDPLIAPTLP